jgi:hypothetical protein
MTGELIEIVQTVVGSSEEKAEIGVRRIPVEKKVLSQTVGTLLLVLDRDVGHKLTHIKHEVGDISKRLQIVRKQLYLILVVDLRILERVARHRHRHRPHKFSHPPKHRHIFFKDSCLLFKLSACFVEQSYAFLKRFHLINL